MYLRTTKIISKRMAKSVDETTFYIDRENSKTFYPRHVDNHCKIAMFNNNDNHQIELDL